MGGFRYLLGGLLGVGLVFGGLSVWPLVAGNWSTPPPQAAPLQVSPRPLPPLPPLTPPAAPLPAGPSYTFADEREETPASRSWLYTSQSAILRVEPGGIGHRAPSASHAPLTIARGTRLWPIQTEGEWVLLRSPGGTLGWMHASEVDTRCPYIEHKY